MEYENLTGPEKVAIVILSMPQDTVRDYLNQLSDEEVEKALAAVSRMEKIPTRVQRLVMNEFQESRGEGDREHVVVAVEDGAVGAGGGRDRRQLGPGCPGSQYG